MISLLAAASVALSQGPAAGPRDSVATLVAGLRAAVKAHPDSFELVFGLGRYLGRTADEVESHWEQRVEARRLLDHAVRLRPNDPRPMLEFGMVLRKQHEQMDGLRVLQRAEGLARHADSTLTRADLADIHEQLALIYQVWWEDWANLGFLSSMFGSGGLRCSRITRQSAGDFESALIQANFLCPREYNETMKRWSSISFMKEDDRVAMIHHFAAAVEADSNRVYDALRALRWLADWGKWDDYLTQARSLARRHPGDADVMLFLGLGEHEMGHAASADSAFRRALVISSAELRKILKDVTPVLSPEEKARLAALSDDARETAIDAYWAARDPIYLTSENERLAEHYARVAFADLAFTSPTQGIPGRLSDKGRVWIFFGRPVQIRSIQANAGGRTEFWDYGEKTPDFVFHRQLTYRGASGEYSSEEESLIPTYRPTHPAMVGSIPFQAARFRASDTTTELNVYAAVPVDSLSHNDADSVLTGFFVLTPQWQPIAAARQPTTIGQARTHEHFVATLRPGIWGLSVEAMGNDRAVTARDTVSALPGGNALAMSDLLLADAIASRGATPRVRSELAIEGSPTLEFKQGKSVGVVWEIYHPWRDSAGTAHYHVRVDVRDQRGGLVRALRSITLQGNATESVLEWDVDRPLRIDEPSLEFTTLGLQNAEPGGYRLVVTVTDRTTHTTATAERRFTITP